MGDTCGNCGAPAEGIICTYCGCALVSLESKEEQMGALREYHESLTKADRDKQVKMLRGGYLPRDPEVLVDAGMRLIPMIETDDMSNEPEASAVDRLLMIKTKLEICEQTPQVVAAIKQFDKIMGGRSTRTLLFGVGMAVFVLAALGIVLFFVFR